MVIKGLKKKVVSQKKKQSLRYVVDCSTAVADNVIDPAGLVSFQFRLFFFKPSSLSKPVSQPFLPRRFQ